MDIWTTSLPPAADADSTEVGLPQDKEDDEDTAIANLPMSNNPGGCDIDGEFYMDGMQVSYA